MSEAPKSDFVAIRALAGFNYVRAGLVIAVSATEPTKCTIIMTGGVPIPCNEPAKDILARLEAGRQAAAATSNEEAD